MSRKTVRRETTVTTIDEFERPHVDAALRRQMNVVRRQPMSLARALGDREYVRVASEAARALDPRRKTA